MKAGRKLLERKFITERNRFFTTLKYGVFSITLYYEIKY